MNFLIEEGHDGEGIIIRTDSDTRLAAAARDTVVAFEVDEFHADSRTEWSVVVTGRAHRTGTAARLKRSGLRAWAPGRKAHFIRVSMDLISGRRINADGQR